MSTDPSPICLPCGQGTSASGATPVGQAGGASGTSLDPDETSVELHLSCPPCPVPLDPKGCPHDRDAIHTAFRHSGTRQHRDAVRRALAALDVPNSRLERFDACGQAAWVLEMPGEQPFFALATNRCRDRFCPACQADRRLLLQRNMRTKLPDRVLRFVTLTLRTSAVPLTDQIDRLLHCFRCLRSRKWWKSLVDGGIFFLEITKHPDTHAWHPHLHLLCTGHYIPQSQLRDTWLAITGDSYIVDVRFVRDRNAAASYVAKYASKGINAVVWSDPAALREAILALAGRRLFNVFGTWKDLGLSKPPDPSIGWVVLCPLWQLIEKARDGDSRSQAILLRLKGADHGTFDVDPHGPSPPPVPPMSRASDR